MDARAVQEFGKGVFSCVFFIDLTHSWVQAVLKRVLRVSHPMLQLHILKLIKSQVPFCGRKWRQCVLNLLAR